MLHSLMNLVRRNDEQRVDSATPFLFSYLVVIETSNNFNVFIGLEEKC